MGEKSSFNLLRNLLGSFFVLFSLFSLVISLYLINEYLASLFSDLMIFYPMITLMLSVYLGFLGYGILRLRKYALLMHDIFLFVSAPLYLLSLISMYMDFRYSKNLLLILFAIILVSIPVFCKLFFKKYKKKFVHVDTQSSIKPSFYIIISGVLLSIPTVIISFVWGMFLYAGLIVPDRTLYQKIENDSFKVCIYKKGYFEECYMDVVFIDKHSLLKREETIFQFNECLHYEMKFIDAHIVRLYNSDQNDSLSYDLHKS